MEMADHPAPDAHGRNMLSTKSALCMAAIAGILLLAAWSVYFRFVVGRHPLSPFVMPVAPSGEAKVQLGDRIGPTVLLLRRRGWDVPQEVADEVQHRRIRDAMTCRLRFVIDLDERRRFEAKNRDWIEVWQDGRVIFRVYFGAFLEFPTSSGEWLLYCGCPELYPQLRREAEALAGSDAGVENGTAKDDPP